MGTAITTSQRSTSTAYPATSKRRYKWIGFGLYALTLAILVWYFIDGATYYLTPYSERPFHPDYRLLRPAGSRGLIFGIIGSSMMIIMLVYSIRKRTGLLGKSIPLRSLLNFHIYLGIFGPLFIVLHTSFKVQGLVAVSFWSMVAVALSGFFGRYLYSQIPRNIDGQEQGLRELEEEQAAMHNQLRTRFNFDDAAFARVSRIFSRETRNQSSNSLTSVFALMFGDLFRPFSQGRMKSRLRGAVSLPQTEMHELFQMSYRLWRTQRRISALADVQKLFHYWHVIHKPFAIIMYLIMIVHIGVALWAGYGWFN